MTFIICGNLRRFRKPTKLILNYHAQANRFKIEFRGFKYTKLMGSCRGGGGGEV